MVALLGPNAEQADSKQFALPGVDIFTGNDLDPSDRPGAALVLGGDGTLHRSLPALIESRTPFLHVPLGGGNDFARAVGVLSVDDALAAWKKFISAGTNVREIDAGTITELRTVEDEVAADTDGWTRELDASATDPANHLAVLGPKIMESQLRHAIDRQQRLSALPHFYACVAGVGFDSEANRRANAMPAFLRRHGGYIFGAAGALFAYKSSNITVMVPAPKWAPTDDGWVSKIEEPALLCAVGNTSSYGGGMHLTAHAKLDDGKLDVCFVRAVSRFTILRFFRKVFSGKHLSLKQVEYFQADRVRISTESPMPVYADGEYVCQTPIEFAIMPSALKAIVA